MVDEFNPEATDGDGDGFVQDGTEFERPIEDVAVDPTLTEDVVEDASAPVEDEVITSPEPVETEPAVTSVADGVIGTGTTVKKKKAAKKSEPETETPKKVAIRSERNMSWTGVGKVYRGINIVTETQAEKWLTNSKIRLATPEEVIAEFGKELNS